MKRILTMLMLAVVCLVANAQFGALPPLHQDGNMFRDTHGNPVVLHGAMDTPSPYFSGWRWGGSCNESTITPCITYFDKLFTHMTDTTNGLWCNLFRLHLDPCWTNNSGITAAGFTKVENDWYDPNGTKVGGEADVHQFDKTRLKTYMTSLYSKIAQKALDHGMYVIMRPPGVCPEKIKVGDYYQEYLLTVWDIVSQNSWVKRNAGQLMLELANEPVGLQDANGGSDPRAMHDFFQPIVNKIRENGFTGIILVPGTGYQSNYREYAAYPIEDYNLGYAVHVYPGWYSNSDTQTSAQSFIDNFGKAVPVVKTNPIVVTEIDWSPGELVRDENGNVIYNPDGNPKSQNYGTWGTARTSTWGKSFKAMKDHYGNISMTLTSIADIIDIDEAYYNNKTVVSHGKQAKPEEGCAYACRDWYEEYAQSNLPRVDYENLYSADNMTLMGKYNNPIVNGDFPDCDPIRVGDWYYLASTTFTAFPGATILKSRDLVNWQYCANPLQQISNSDPYKLLNGLNHYSKGQWAPSLNYYNGKFYLNFIAYNHETVNDGGDFMLSTDDPEGTWQMQKVDGFYYDSGFLFDNDGKVYVAHGINNITVSQVDPNAAFKTVTEKTVINAGDKGLEGCHFYHIGDYYYIYATYNTELSQTIFRSTNPLGPYEEHSGRVFEGQRIHQGGLVETQTGEWWTVLFKDAGSIGRVPYLEPVTWTDGWPVIGKAGVDVSKGGSSYNKPNVGKAWPRAYLETNDAFCDPLLGKQWQWNHLPDNGSWSLMERPGFLRLHTASVADNIRQARNSLTQRILGYAKEGATKTPDSYGTICMDVSGMADGDRAGLSVFQKEWASIGVEQTDGKRYFVYRNSDGTETKGDLVNADVVYLRAIANYSTNKAKMYFSTDNATFTQLGGELDMTFSLEVFMGNRFYIYNYATEALGGYVDVDWFSTETDYTEEKFYAPGTLHTFTEDELTAVEVSAPAAQTIVMTGKAEEISVMATFKDGSVKNVAANCKYTVANDNILSIENGNVRGLMDGETDVTAIYTDMLGNEFRVTLPVKVSTFPLLSKYIDARLFGDGSFNDETSTLKTTQYGCGGWVYPNGIDLSPYKYVVIKFAKSIISGCQFHIYDVNNYWASAADVSLSTSTTQKISLANRQKSSNAGPLDLTHIYIFGIWSPSATSFQIIDMFLSNDGKTPVAIEGIPADEDITIDSEQMFDLQGRRITRPAQHGIYIMGGRKILK